MQRSRRGAPLHAAMLLLAVSLPVGAVAAALPEIEATAIGTFVDPLYVTNAGDERLFIVERAGRIRIVDPDLGTLPTPFLDIASTLVDDSLSGGMYTMAFHPQYETNGFFFVAYTETGDQTVFNSVLTRYQVSPDDDDVADLPSGRVLLRVAEPHPGHNIDQVEFGPDGFLYVSFGNGGDHDAEECLAQNDDFLNGKILRLDVDQNVDVEPYYGIPNGNPFADPTDGVPDEIWAKGFRNPWRFSFDSETGDLFIADVGEETREEISRQPAGSPGGENYGWKVMEGTSCFDPAREGCPLDTPPCFDPSYVAPIYEYTTSDTDCAVTGGYVYRGEAIPGLLGRYVFGDVCSAKLWVLEEVEEGVWARSELLELQPPTRFALTSFGRDAAGELYVTLANEVLRLPEPRAETLRFVSLAVLAVLGRASRRGLLWASCCEDGGRELEPSDA